MVVIFNKPQDSKGISKVFEVYRINLGTEFGLKIYTALMIVLPMIPLLILVIRIGNNNWYNTFNELELER